MTQQTWDADHYETQARFVTRLCAGVLVLLRPQACERILDLGCGDGVLTQELMAAGAVVTGIDASASMVAGAVARGVDAHVGDGQALSYAGEFEAVFSNAALHWMPRHADVIDGVWRALVPGGRFVAECGGHGNVATICEALEDALRRRGIDPTPLKEWSYPSVEQFGTLLRQRGFVVEHIETFGRPTPVPAGIIGWVQTFKQPYLRVVAPEHQPEFLREVEAATRSRLYDPATDQWHADYVRLRFVARRPLL